MGAHVAPGPQRRGVRRRLVALAAAAVVLALVPAGMSTAADGDVVAAQGWAREGMLVTFVPQDGHLYVSATAGEPETRIGIEFTDDDADFTDATLELTEADDSLLPDGAEVVACALETPLGGEGQLDEAPAADCRLQLPVTGADGTWSADLDVFRERWDTAPAGIVLVARPSDDTATWRVTFEAEATAVSQASTATTGQQPTATTQPSPDFGDGAPVTTDSGSMADEPTGAWTAPSVGFGTAPAPVEAPAPTPAPGVETGPPTPQLGGAEPLAISVPADADRPSSLLVLAAVAVALAALLGIVRNRPGVTGSSAAGAAMSGVPASLGRVGLAAVALSAPLATGDVTLFRVGLVLIAMIGATGLHVLVNWTGELSLAHAGMIGLPAFVVAKLSADQGWSPLMLLPLAVVLGAAVGTVVGLPALRSRGLQVALVTLAAGLAIERFFFTKPWLIGAAGGVNVADPTIGPFSFTTTRSLYPLIALAFVGTVTAMWALHRSKVARAWLWIRSDPDAASVFGVPVARYRVLAYTVAGAIAGFAGGLTGVWVQRLTPQTFPYGLSFTYLVIVVVGGQGFIGGVLGAAALLEGGRLFFSGADALGDYLGPIALILVLTRYRTGLNGLWRSAMTRLRDVSARVETTTLSAHPTRYTMPFCLGVASVVLGFTAITLAWYHTGNTDQVWIQNQEIASGGFGGLAGVLLGAGLLIRDQIAKGQALQIERFDALLAQRGLTEREIAEPNVAKPGPVQSGFGDKPDGHVGADDTDVRPAPTLQNTRRPRQLEATR